MSTSRQDLKAEIEQLYRDRYVALCRAATAVTGRVETAREAVQDGFALALARRDDFRRSGSLEAWVGRIVLRAALDVRRRRTPEPVVLHDFDQGTLMWAPELPHSDRDSALAAAVEALPPRQRQIVFLRYFADFSHEQVAELLGISSGTVSASLHQARTTLARRLEDPSVKEVQK